MRRGAEILEGLRDGREIWCDGERIGDVTKDRRFAGGARTLAELYDLQCEPDLAPLMSYASPSTGAPVGLSFIEPKSHADLERRRHMVKRWNDHCLGMFPRSPDFLNITLAAFASGAEGFGQFAGNLRGFYEKAREQDLVMTHSLTNPQVDRSRGVAEQAKDLAIKSVRETDAGIVVSGARMLSTLGALADEILIMPAPFFPLPDTEEAKPYALGFIIPAATPGLSQLARPMLYSGGPGSPMDHPLAARFDDSDCMVVFDEVTVPWERVFIHRDVEVFNTIYGPTGAGLHMGHQFIIKDLSKMEFMMGLGFAIAEAIKADAHQHVRGKLAELINFTEFLNACLIACEAQATESAYGTLLPAAGPVLAVRLMFVEHFKRACEIIQIIGAGGLFMLPSFAEFDGARGADVDRYYQAANLDSRSRIKLFRLAYDAALSSFSGRQQLYERFFAADPVRAADRLYEQYDKTPHIQRIHGLLDDLEARISDAPDGPAFGPPPPARD